MAGMGSSAPSLLLPIETSATVLAAAGERALDARCCCLRRRYAASVYLAGYAVEMVLKAATWAVYVLDPTAPSAVTYAAWVRSVGNTSLGVVEPWESGHNPAFWFRYLEALRTRLGRTGVPFAAWDPAFWFEAERRILWFRANWRVELRYSTYSVGRLEGVRAARHAAWLCQQQGRLRS